MSTCIIVDGDFKSASSRKIGLRIHSCLKFVFCFGWGEGEKNKDGANVELPKEDHFQIFDGSKVGLYNYMIRIWKYIKYGALLEIVWWWIWSNIGHWSFYTFQVSHGGRLAVSAKFYRLEIGLFLSDVAMCFPFKCFQCWKDLLSAKCKRCVDVLSISVSSIFLPFLPFWYQNERFPSLRFCSLLPIISFHMNIAWVKWDKC